MKTERVALPHGLPRQLVGEPSHIKVAVIGQGYVGLPLAMAAVSAGHTVAAFDSSAPRVAMLVAGSSFTTDVTDTELDEALRTGRYILSTDPGVLTGFDIAIITVPTPLKDGAPDLTFVEQAAETAGRYLRAGATVVLESTSYPGTTEQVVLPLLEKWSGLSVVEFHLGFSPERIDPGNQTWTFESTPKLVAGLEPCCTEEVDRFYRSIVETTVRVPSLVTAELAKIMENTFRHVNIALVNEMAMVSQALGISVWDVLDAASTKPYGFMRFSPGPGVGGHCLPVDPAYLSWQVERELGESFRMIELANDINTHMPRHVVQRAAGLLNDEQRSVNGSAVLLLGMSYKAGTSDVRESPTYRIVELLRKQGAKVSIADPHADPALFPAPAWAPSPERSIAEFDLVILVTDHAEFDDEYISGARRVYDCRNHFAPVGHIEKL
jgi:UDP-N-acetyl-D-glucosamine dehydrogenase